MQWEPGVKSSTLSPLCIYLGTWIAFSTQFGILDFEYAFFVGSGCGKCEQCIYALLVILLLAKDLQLGYRVPGLATSITPRSTRYQVP